VTVLHPGRFDVEKNTEVPIKQDAGWVLESVWTRQRREASFAPV